MCNEANQRAKNAEHRAKSAIDGQIQANAKLLEMHARQDEDNKKIVIMSQLLEFIGEEVQKLQ